MELILNISELHYKNTYWLLLYFNLLYLYFIICLLLYYCSWFIMYSDYVEGTVFHMKKNSWWVQSDLSDKQVN